MGRYKERALVAEERTRRATTLADLREAKISVFCWCNRCGHNAEAATEMLIGQLGPDFPVPEIGTRMRCSSCGSKDIATRPSWPTQGQIARHH